MVKRRLYFTRWRSRHDCFFLCLQRKYPTRNTDQQIQHGTESVISEVPRKVKLPQPLAAEQSMPFCLFRPSCSPTLFPMHGTGSSQHVTAWLEMWVEVTWVTASVRKQFYLFETYTILLLLWWLWRVDTVTLWACTWLTTVSRGPLTTHLVQMEAVYFFL